MRRAVLCALVFAALLALVWGTRASWLAPRLRRELTAALEEATGARVEISGLGGSYLGSLEITGARVVDESGKARLASLELDRARVDYSLWAFLTGAPDALARCSVEVDGLRVALRLDAPGADGAGDEGSSEASWSLPARWPSLRADGVDLELGFAQRTLSVRGASLRTKATPGGQDLSLTAPAARWRVKDAGERAAELRLDLAWRRPRLEVASLRLGPDELVRRAFVDFDADEGRALAFELDASLSGGALQLGGRSDLVALELDLETSGLDLGPLARLWDPGASDIAATGVDLKGELDLDPRRDDPLSWSLAGSTRGVRVLGRALDSLEVDAGGRGRELTIARLLARRGDERLEARALSLPLGASTFETLRGARGKLEFELVDLPSWIEGASPTGAARAPDHRLALSAELTDEGLVVEGGELTTAGGRFRLRPGSILPGAGDGLLDQAWVDLGFDVDFSDLASLGAVLASDSSWSGSLQGDVHAIGTWDSLSGRFDVEGSDVVVLGVSLGDLRTVATLDARRLEIETLVAKSELLELDLSGGWDLARGEADDLRVVASTRHMDQLFPSAFVEGDLRLEARLSGSPLDPSGPVTASFERLRLAARPERAFENASLSGSFRPGRLQVDSLSAQVEAVALQTRGAFEHGGWLMPYTVELEELDLVRGPLDLVLVQPTRVRLEAGVTLIEECAFLGSAGELVFDLERYADAWSARARGVDLDAMPLLEPVTPPGFQLSGLNGELELALDADRLELSVGLDVERLRPAADWPEFALGARARLGSGELVLERLDADLGELGRIELSGRAPLDPRGAELLGDGPLELVGRVDVQRLAALPAWRAVSENDLEGEVQLDFRFGGTWEHVLGELRLDSKELALVTERGGGTALFGPARVALALEFGDDVRVAELSLGSPKQIGFDGAGRLGARLDLRRLLREGSGWLLAAPLDVSGQLRAQDLGFLARRLGLRRLAGEVSGEFTVGGSLQRPLPTGRLALEGGELRLTGDFPAFDALHAEVVLEEGRARVVELAGELGGGEVKATGEVDWVEDGVRVDLQLSGREALVVQRPTTRVRADAELTLRGPLERLELAGAVRVRDGRYSRDVRFLEGGSSQPGAESGVRLFSFESGALANVQFDVEVTSVEAFRIQNNLARGSARLDLRLAGTGRAPELLGSVFVDPSRVALPAALLRTTSGTIRFERDDPLMPQLDVRLETRVRGYDISMHVEGPSDAPEVELVSVPPLPSEDVLLLLLTGKPPESNWSAETGGAAAQTVAFFVGKDLLGRWFDDGWSDEESLLDRIEWSSGEDVTQSGGQTSELAIRVFGVAATGGRTIWLRAENDVYDRNNFGVRFVLRFD